MFAQWHWAGTKDLGFRWQILQIDQNAVILKHQEISWQLTKWHLLQNRMNPVSNPAEFSQIVINTLLLESCFYIHKRKRKKNQNICWKIRSFYIYKVKIFLALLTVKKEIQQQLRKNKIFSINSSSSFNIVIKVPLKIKLIVLSKESFQFQDQKFQVEKKSNWTSLNFRREYNSINELLSENQGNYLQKEELAKSLWELRLLYDSKWNLVLIIDDALVVGILHSGNSLKKKKNSSIIRKHIMNI